MFISLSIKNVVKLRLIRFVRKLRTFLLKVFKYLFPRT